MKVNLKWFFKVFTIVLLFLESIENMKVKNFTKGLINTSNKKKIYSELIKRFSKPDYDIQEEENLVYDLIRKESSGGQLEKKYVRDIKLYLKKYNFYKTEDLRIKMKIFNEHLCDILLPRGIKNLKEKAKNVIGLEELKKTTEEIKHDDLIIIDRFQKTVHGLFSIYEQRIEPTEYYEQRHIRRQQIQGIIYGNKIMMYILQKNGYTYEFVLKKYLNPLSKKNLRKRIEKFITELILVFARRSNINLFNTNIGLQLKAYKKKKFKKFSDIKEEAVKILFSLTQFNSNNEFFTNEAEAAFGVFMSHPFESYFLLEWENLKGNDIPAESSKNEEIQINTKEPIKDFIKLIFRRMNKNIENMKTEITNFVEKLYTSLQLSKDSDNTDTLIKSVNACVRKTDTSYIILKTCKPIVEQKFLPASKDIIENTSTSFMRLDTYISYEYLELYLFKIVELRGLFFYVFEYILYQFEKTIQNVNQLSFHAVPAISAAIEETLRTSSFALNFLPSDYVSLLANYFDEDKRKKSILLKSILKKLQIDKKDSITNISASEDTKSEEEII